MKWIKKGLVYRPSGGGGWAHGSALQPTPFVRRDGVIRVYAGFRDPHGVSRVGFVDVDGKDPSKVLRISGTPALDIGEPGGFDENGVVPCAVIERDGALYLYYAGYQLGQKVRFYVFSGLAISRDGGETFTRVSRAPFCDRTDDERLFRVVHSVMQMNGRWRMWYGAGSEFSVYDGRQVPVYNIRCSDCDDGLSLGVDYRICVDTAGAEHRVGRPYVIRLEQSFRMFFGAGDVTNGYRLAYADSPDGVTWTRKDSEVGIDVSATGWDSEMQAYPAVIKSGGQVYLLYNGNNYGADGFGYAALETW